MPMTRKVIQVGTSRAVTIPHEFLDFYRSRGEEIHKVSIEVTDKIVITPIFKKETINGAENNG